MTRTATLENVINVVHQQSINHFDEIVPVQDMEFDSLTQMWVSGKRVEVAPSAQRLDCPIDCGCRIRTCPGVRRNCRPRTSTYWMEQEAQQRQTFFCRFDANRLRAVFTERYTAIDHMEVLTKMLEYGFDPAGEIQFSLDDEMLVLKVPEHSRAFHLVGEGQNRSRHFHRQFRRWAFWPCPSRHSITGWSAPTGLSPKPPWMPATSTSHARSWTSSPTSCEALSASPSRDKTGF